MKNENSVVQTKPSVSLSMKSEDDSPLKKLSSKITYNNFVKQLALDKNIYSSNKLEPSNLVQELIQNRANSSSNSIKNVCNGSQVNFNRELEDPDNEKVKNELEKMLVVLSEMKQIGDNFEELER
jgi:hypothetical protein